MVNLDRLKSVGLSGYRTWKLWIEPERVAMRRTVRRWLEQAAPSGVVVEIGAGTAFMRPVIMRAMPGAHYVSTDIAPTENTNLVVDACDLPLADRSVDVILALEVLEHIPTPERLVEEAARVLVPGGRLILTVPFMFGVHDFRDYYRFTPLGLETMVQRHGLTLREVKLRGGAFVAASSLIRTLILNAIVGRPRNWRAQGRSKKVRWLLATAVLTPWALITTAAYGLDRLFDRNSASPAGYFFLCARETV